MPGYMTPYIGLTRQSAKNIIWPQITRLNRELGLGLELTKSELRAAHPNGSELFVVGANADEEIDKLRGNAFPFAGVDEAQAFRDSVLEELLDDVLSPGLADLEGPLWLKGTPGITPAGYFYRATTGQIPGFDIHHWTYLDNPFLPLDLPGQTVRTDAEKLARRRAFLKRWLADRGYDETHPTYRREWLGEWVRDDSEVVYAYTPECLIDSMPDNWAPDSERWVHVIGIDYGYVDSTAWVVWAFRASGDDSTCYAVESFARAGLTPSEAGEVTRTLRDRYGAAALVGDAGGLGKGYVEEARARFGLQIETAEKQEKRAAIEIMNGAYRATTPRIRILRGANAQLVDESTKLQWDLRYPRDDPRWHTVEDYRFSNHCTDAALYGWRRCHAWLNTEPDPPERDEEERRWDVDDLDWEDRDDKPWWDAP